MEYLVYNIEDRLVGSFPSLMEAAMFVENGGYIREKDLDKVNYLVYDDDGNELGEFTSKDAALTFAEGLKCPCVVVAEEVIYSTFED